MIFLTCSKCCTSLQCARSVSDGYSGVIVQVNFGFEAELADGFAVSARLLRGSGRCELNVLDTECIKSLGDGDFFFGVEESVGKLLTLCITNQTRAKVQNNCKYLEECFR
jgi:hypothetical protein